MKRSEMIDQIVDLLEWGQDHYSLQTRADHLLKTLENAGMLKCTKRDLGEMGNLWTPEGWEQE